MIDGTVKFARYAFMPNKLGYCGGDDNRTLFEYCAAQHTDPGLVVILQKFEAAYPYLKLIAHSNNIADPFDARVVEAYWLGNELLDRVEIAQFYNSLRERFSKRLDGKTLDLLLSKAPRGARPFHSFHVFDVHSRTGTITHSLETMEKCRIGWGQVKSIENGSLIVEHRPLALAESKLKLGNLTTKRVQRQIDHAGFIKDCQAGDWVSIHWDWACEKLTPAQVQNLDKYTRYHIALANQTL
jgi:hydrogenase maturation factor